VRLHRATIALSLGLLLITGLTLGEGWTVAQETSDHATHPVHIHQGTCDELDPAPLYPLSDIGPQEGVSVAGSASAVEISETTVEASLDDIATGQNAFNVHESADNIGNYIACGEIGTLESGDRIAVALRETNDSGYSGIAVLERAGDQATDVSIFLTGGAAGAAGEMTGDASPESAMASVQVDIANFAYDPDPVTVPAGGSITWTNQDSAPHTATATDRAVLQSGTLNEGDSFTQAFETPGTYEYFCEFHANMSGTVIVE
jgi:plastocyanin